MMLRWISLEPPPRAAPWRPRLYSPNRLPGVSVPAGQAMASSPASSRPISDRRVTLTAPNNFMTDPAAPGMAPVVIPTVTRSTSAVATIPCTVASASRPRARLSLSRPRRRIRSTSSAPSSLTSCLEVRPTV